MNLPNKLTLSRVFIIPFFVSFLLVENLWPAPLPKAICRWVALVLFVIAAITDYYDGKIARRENLVTNFGKLFDPLADKLLTMAAFVSFVELQRPNGGPILPAWAIIIILAREFVVTGLRTLASAQGRVIGADKWGKQKTVWQIIGIFTILTALCLHDTLKLCQVRLTTFDAALPYVYNVVLVVVVVLTVVSGMLYLVRNWDMVREQ